MLVFWNVAMDLASSRIPWKEGAAYCLSGRLVSPDRREGRDSHVPPAARYSFSSTIARSLITLSLPLASILRFSRIRSSRLWNLTVCTLFSAK